LIVPHVFFSQKSPQKLQKAVQEEAKSHDVFDELDSSISDKTRELWTKQEHMAVTYRGEHLKIYQSQIDECRL
jgi:hypothetical protein